jgi:serine/threonine-protein kinase
VTCPTCGAELSPGTRFCPVDGTTVRPDTQPTKAGAGEDPLIGRTVDGRYAIRAILGKGGVGAVYRAEHVEIKKPVALKILQAAFARTDEYRRRFEREARAASRLSHPSCVSVLDFGRISQLEPSAGGEQLLGSSYLVMEFVAGELLADRIDRGKLPPSEAVVIARGVLSALRHAHALHLVHRDVKPGNIMLSSASVTAPLVKLLDFGLAKNVGQDSADAQQVVTQAGMVFGTPGYISPEQAGGQPADARSDLYAVGVVLFEMLCGGPPFTGAAAIDVVRAHLLQPPPSPRKLEPGLSPQLEEIVLKALQKDPAKRFQTAEAFAAALGACPESSAVPSKKAVALVSRRARLVDFVRRHRGSVAAGVAALVLNIIAGIVVAFIYRPSPPVSANPPPVEPAAVPPSAPASPSAQRHLALAADYQRRLWCADTIEELERALHEDPQLRANPEVTRLAIPCLRPRSRARTLRFLVDRVGPDARAELQAASVTEPRTEIREGAAQALQQLGP